MIATGLTDSNAHRFGTTGARARDTIFSPCTTAIHTADAHFTTCSTGATFGRLTTGSSSPRSTSETIAACSTSETIAGCTTGTSHRLTAGTTSHRLTTGTACSTTRVREICVCISQQTDSLYTCFLPTNKSGQRWRVGA